MFQSISRQPTALAILMMLLTTHAHAQLTELAYYHLGEGDPGAVAGGNVTSSVEVLGTTLDIDLEVFSPPGVVYSDDTPAGYDTSLSVSFDSSEAHLFTVATAWQNQYPGFRVGMEAFLKVDPSMVGTESVPFGDGTGYHLGITADGFYSANTTGPGITPVNYGEWQHVAFWTTGSNWQIYVDGVPQFETLPNFTYNSPGGFATVGADNDFVTPFEGLIDEHRVFTWTGAFNPADLLWYSLRDVADGDVNEDGLVDTADYDIWRRNVDTDLTGLSAIDTRMLGDLDANRLINLDDFGIIKANKSPGVVFGVPEPGSCLLLLTGLVASVVWLQRRSGSPCLRHRNGLKKIAILAALLAVSQPNNLFAQATWGGGDGNWNDANWSGGSGGGGAPASGDTVVLPSSTGTITVTNNIGIQFNELQQQGGILNIEPAGALEFTGLAQNGLGSDAAGELNLAGELVIGGGFNIGFDSVAKVAIDGSAKLRVAGDMDTWWADGAVLAVTGGNADVEVGGTFYIGTGATMEVSIDSNTFSTFKVPGDVNFPGGNGTLDVNFSGGFSPVVGDSWTLFDTPSRAGTIPIVNTPDLGPGTVLAVNYSEGGNLGQVVTLDVSSALNLMVDTATGVATINNPASGADDIDIDGFIIRSVSGSLNEAGFTGLGEAGWLPGLSPSQSDSLLSETNFNSSTTIGTASSFDIGQVFNSTGARDLSLEFHLAGGGTLQGTVQYLADRAGDFDGSGAVGNSDLTLLLDNWGATVPPTPAGWVNDLPTEPAVGNDELTRLLDNWGNTSALSASTVPEPTSMAIAFLAAVGGLAACRRF